MPGSWRSPSGRPCSLPSPSAWGGRGAAPPRPGGGRGGGPPPPANRVLGNLIGETGGYLLTSAWTLLVLAALGTAFAGRGFIALGAISAALVLVGVLSPLDLPIVDTANFIG